MMNSSGKRGFTLLEILIVISIIAILVGILMPAFTGIMQSAKIKRATTESKALATAIRAYHAVNTSWPMQNSNADIVYTNGNSALIQLLVSQQGQNFTEDIVPGQSMTDPFRLKLPYRIFISPLGNSVTVQSCGPNCIDEGGGGDDIVARH